MRKKTYICIQISVQVRNVFSSRNKIVQERSRSISTVSTASHASHFQPTHPCAGGTSGRKIASVEDLRTQSLRAGTSGKSLDMTRNHSKSSKIASAEASILRRDEDYAAVVAIRVCRNVHVIPSFFFRRRRRRLATLFTRRSEG